METIEKNGYYYDPPSWKVCSGCKGEGEISRELYKERYGELRDFMGNTGYKVECPTCADSPKSGYLPLHYTPEQWKAAGGVLTDDTPVWGWDGEEWLYCIYEEREKDRKYIIATSAGIPEEEE